MVISFDLDGTLISRSPVWPIEDELPSYGTTGEQLRLGTVEIFGELRVQGHAIWIYTNSYRGWRDLKRWFNDCDLPVDGIINQVRHDHAKALYDPGFSGEKCPGWFGIDLHFDDHDLEGAQCVAVRLDSEDSMWVQYVLDMVARSGQLTGDS